MNQETIGQRLQRLRREAGLSQPQLAEAAAVPIGTIRNWEQGRRMPLLDTAARVARALGVSIDDLALEGPAAAAPAKSPSKSKPAPRRRKGKGS